MIALPTRVLTRALLWLCLLLFFLSFVSSLREALSRACCSVLHSGKMNLQAISCRRKERRNVIWKRNTQSAKQRCWMDRCDSLVSILFFATAACVLQDAWVCFVCCILLVFICLEVSSWLICDLLKLVVKSQQQLCCRWNANPQRICHLVSVENACFCFFLWSSLFSL